MRPLIQDSFVESSPCGSTCRSLRLPWFMPSKAEGNQRVACSTVAWSIGTRNLWKCQWACRVTGRVQSGPVNGQSAAGVGLARKRTGAKAASRLAERARGAQPRRHAYYTHNGPDFASRWAAVV